MDDLKPAGGKTRWIVAGAVLLPLLLISRISYHCPFLFGWDGIQFALSLEHFDVRIHQPHPPGYLLYSFSLRALNFVIHDANVVMIAMNVLATAGAMLFIALLIWELSESIPDANRFWLAIGGAAIYLTNPVCWLYSCVSEMYPVEGFFSACILYLLIRSFRKPASFLWASVVMAIAGGFRPSTEALLFPAYLLVLFRAGKRRVLLSIVLVVILNAAWASILVWLSGGLGEYLQLTFGQAMQAREEYNVLLSAPDSISRLRLIAILMLQGVTIPLLLAVLVRSLKIRFQRVDAILITAVVVPFAVFTFLYLGKIGYILILIPALIVGVAVHLGRLYRSKGLFVGILLLSCFLNFQCFVHASHYPGKPSELTTWQRLVNDFNFINRWLIRHRALRMQQLMKQAASLRPGRIAFVLTQSDAFPDWRTAMYYFPDDDVLLLHEDTGRTAVARNHEIGSVSGSWSTEQDSALFVVTEDPLDLPIHPVAVDETRWYCARVEDLPVAFEIEGLAFENNRSAHGHQK